ncbi:MAG: AAA family ATPase, partial [Myxococcales bacterium]|nr:AAA family ATPase [Myxococcales bacterium]
RDIKPENVLVTPDGRVVILDFGLAASAASRGIPSAPGEIAGTVAYMAPEQCWGGAIHASADLYAVGVILYRVLTGEQPHAGSIEEMLKGRPFVPPVHPARIVRDAPRELVELAMGLLDTTPERRPSAAQAYQTLVGHALPNARRVPAVRGRAPEHARLRGALERVGEERRPIITRITGAPGFGKTSLASTFVAESEHPGRTVVLRGRCSPMEDVPYNAFDAVISDLGRYLARWPEPAVAALLPEDQGALLRVFPVLGQVPGLGAVEPASALVGELELRDRGLAALRELLAGLAERFTLIVWMDDVHWADVDSASVLRALTRGPDAPPILWVLGHLTSAPQACPLLTMAIEYEPADSDAVELAPLEPVVVEALVREALEEVALPDVAATVEFIVTHAQGSPAEALSFAWEVARAMEDQGALETGALIESLVARRLARQPERARQLLEVIALASCPIELVVAIEAAGLLTADGARDDAVSVVEVSEIDATPIELASALVNAQLAAWVEDGLRARLTMFHRRVRDAIVTQIEPERRRSLHAALANAVASHQEEDLEALAYHSEAAGDRERALEFIFAAARRAERAHAFEATRRLLERALAIGVESARREATLAALAQAQIRCGRGADAAKSLLAAAEACGVDSDTGRAYRCQAAEQWIKSGYLDRGWAELERVLAHHRIKVPQSHRRALASSAWHRSRFLLRSRKLDRAVASRSTSALTSAATARRDALWTAFTSLSSVNYTLSDVFALQHLHDAIDGGGDSTLCRALAYEAASEAYFGDRVRRQLPRLLDHVRALAERTGSPYDAAWRQLASAVVMHARGRWSGVVEHGLAAEAIFLESCPGSYWERTMVAMYVDTALAMLGQLTRLKGRVSALEEDARRRGDLRGQMLCHTGEISLTWLARDRVSYARGKMRELLGQVQGEIGWRGDEFQTWFHAELIAEVHGALYEAEPWRAWGAVLEHWDKLEAAMMLELRLVGCELRQTRARAALAAAATFQERQRPPPPLDPRWTRARLLADVRKQIKLLRREGLDCADGWAELLAAGVHHLEGDDDQARRALDLSVRIF